MAVAQAMLAQATGSGVNGGVESLSVQIRAAVVAGVPQPGFVSV